MLVIKTQMEMDECGLIYFYIITDEVVLSCLTDVNTTEENITPVLYWESWIRQRHKQD